MKKNDLIKQRTLAFDHLFDGVFITDSQGLVLDWNRGAGQIYGLTREEMLGKSVSSIFADDHVEKTLETVLRTVQRRGMWQGQIIKRDKEGGSGWVETIVEPEGGPTAESSVLIWVGRDITARVLLEKRMEALEYYDQLTKIPNRFLMYDRLQQLLATSRRNGQMFGLYFVDLDDFREVNLQAGQSAGDDVLREVAQRMQSVLRQSDTVARVGSDEFVVLAGGLRNEQDALHIRDNIRAVFDGAIHAGGQAFHISASIGMVIHPRDGDTSDDLLIRADRAMEVEKKAHRLVPV